MIMTLKAIDCSEKKDWGGGGVTLIYKLMRGLFLIPV